MKKLKLATLLIAALTILNVAKAQNCKFFSMTKGSGLTYQNFDALGVVTFYSKTICNDVTTDISGSTAYLLKTEIDDAKFMKMSSRDFAIKCKDGKWNIDLVSFVNHDVMKEFQSTNINIDTNNIVYPEILTVGLTLPNAKVTISTAGSDGKMATTVITATNRKVVGMEKVSVLPGVFDCYKITFDMEISGPSKKTYHVVEYISEGVGKIKSETFDKKGKLTSSSLLIELKK